MIWYLNGDPLTKNQQCAVPLGVQGENATLVYTADCSDWLEEWPDGIIALLLKAPDGSDPYVADTATDAQTGTVTWTVSAYDTAIPGYGWGELRLVQSAAVKKSWTFRTYIRPSILADAGDPPAPTPDWVDDLLEEASEAMAETRANAELAADAADDAGAAKAAAEVAQGRAEDAAEAAEQAVSGATSDAEAWANGTRDGEPVTSGDPAYHNNSKYYSEQAGTSEIGAAASAVAAENGAKDAEAWAKGTRGGTPVGSSDPAYENNAAYYAADAGTEAAAAGASAGDAEAWAKGTRNGSAVSGSDPAYHNNSKYYADQAAETVASIGDEVEDAEAWAKGTRGGDPVTSDDPAYQANSKYYSEQAAAAAAGITAEAEDAEAWAAGTRGGVAVTSGDPAYENNAKYYADQAAQTDVGTLEAVVDEMKTVLTVSGDASADLSELDTDEYKKISSDGSFASSTYATSKLWAYDVQGYSGVTFRFASRASGENKYAFYNATTLATCGSATLVGSVTSYTTATETTVTVPDGAKTLVIGAKTKYSISGLNHYMISKADANLAEAYSPSKIYYINDHCANGGNIYRRTVYTGAAEADFDATKWVQVRACDEIGAILSDSTGTAYFDTSLFQVGSVGSDGNVNTSQKYRVVNTNIMTIQEQTTLEYASGFTVWIYYYDANGDYIDNNGGVTTWAGRTILAGSRIRVTIRKTGVSDDITTNEIPGFVHGVSFLSSEGKRRQAITENTEGSLEALDAKMFQKGATPILNALAPCILVAGQSNIAGRIDAANLPETITPPFNNIKISRNDSTGAFEQSVTLPTQWGIDFPLYSALNELGTTWYVIKRAVGGTSISPLGDGSYHWTPFYEELDDISKSLLFTFNTQIAKCLAVNANTFDFRAFVWQQGEGDRRGAAKRAAVEYYRNFRAMIAYVRGVTGNKRLPVVCGTVSHLSTQYDPMVEEATLRLANEDPYMICIDMSGATMVDNVHFNAAAAVYFGYKAYDALIDLGVVTGTKINPACPWEV